MEPAFIQWLIGQVGIGGLAGFALYQLNRAYEEALKREEEYSNANREDKKMLIDVLHANAKSMAGVEQALRGVEQALRKNS